MGPPEPHALLPLDAPKLPHAAMFSTPKLTELVPPPPPRSAGMLEPRRELSSILPQPPEELALESPTPVTRPPVPETATRSTIPLTAPPPLEPQPSLSLPPPPLPLPTLCTEMLNTNKTFQ